MAVLGLIILANSVIAKPLYNMFEPNTAERKQVLLEIFDAVFVRTRSPSKSGTAHSIRGDLERMFGYVSRTGVDYIHATLGHIHNVNLEEMEEWLYTSHMPKQYKHYCHIPVALHRRMQEARNIVEWLSFIELLTGRSLVVTRQYLADHAANAA